MLYCIKVFRELEDVEIIHHSFKIQPTRKEVLKIIENAELNYNDDYGRFSYFPVERRN